MTDLADATYDQLIEELTRRTDALFAVSVLKDGQCHPETNVRFEIQIAPHKDFLLLGLVDIHQSQVRDRIKKVMPQSWTDRPSDYGG